MTITQAYKKDDDKPRMDLVPALAMSRIFGLVSEVDGIYAWLAREPDTEDVLYNVARRLIEEVGLEEIARVFTFGAAKYEDFGWLRGSGMKARRIAAAALRHLTNTTDGGIDPESGLSHRAHAAACVLMLIETLERWPENDDRFLQDNTTESGWTGRGELAGSGDEHTTLVGRRIP